MIAPVERAGLAIQVSRKVVRDSCQRGYFWWDRAGFEDCVGSTGTAGSSGPAPRSTSLRRWRASWAGWWISGAGRYFVVADALVAAVAHSAPSSPLSPPRSRGCLRAPGLDTLDRRTVLACPNEVFPLLEDHFVAGTCCTSHPDEDRWRVTDMSNTCGCGVLTTDTEPRGQANGQCGCGCGTTAKSRDEEIAELRELRQSITQRLHELEGAARR